MPRAASDHPQPVAAPQTYLDMIQNLVPTMPALFKPGPSQTKQRVARSSSVSPPSDEDPHADPPGRSPPALPQPLVDHHVVDYRLECEH